MGRLTGALIGILVGSAVNRLYPAASGNFAVAQVLAVTGALTGGYVRAAFNPGTLTSPGPKALLAAPIDSLLFLFIFRKIRIA